MATAVAVRDLTKHYGSLVAVDQVSFSIEEGEIFGILGPNGAGKTTTIEIIESLRKPDVGAVEVCGIDVTRQADRVKEIIGVQLQSTSLYDRVTVTEAIDLFGSYYPGALPTAEVLTEMSLDEKRDSFVEELSGGQQQRLALALALVNDPKVLFLDEPTTALDPQARRAVWDIIERLRRRGKTIILNTHYMEEAERLCDRVGIMDHGHIIAMDTPTRLIATQNLDSAIEFTSSDTAASEIVATLPAVNKVTQDGDRFIVYTKDALSLLVEVVRLYQQQQLNLTNISVRAATLEDVFLELTGRKLRE